MMLASTVQFSRYGRYPSSIAAWRRRFGPTEVTSPAAVPSGPNSVLGPRTPRERRPVPLPRQGAY